MPPDGAGEISLKFPSALSPSRPTITRSLLVKGPRAAVTQFEACIFFYARSLREDLNQLDAITRVSPKHPEHRGPHYILIILFIADRSTQTIPPHLGIVSSRRGTFARLHAGYKVFSSGIK